MSVGWDKSISGDEYDEKDKETIDYFKQRIFGRFDLNKEIFIFMCNHLDYHWTLSVVDRNLNKYFIIDSLPGCGSHEGFVNVLKQMNICEKNIEIINLKIHRQNDYWSCGYHMLYYFKKLFINQLNQNYELLNNYNEQEFSDHMKEMEYYFNKFKSIVWFRIKYKDQMPQILINNIFNPLQNSTIEDVYVYLLNNHYEFDDEGYLVCLKE